jgi:hypothetical protein
MAARPRAITSEEFMDALAAAHVVRDTDVNTISRIVIDARRGYAVQIYLERFGDQRLLNIAPAMTGVGISSVAAPEEGSDGKSAQSEG